MPRWRRRRLRRIRPEPGSFFFLRTHLDDGTVMKKRCWSVPRAELPPGVKVWKEEEVAALGRALGKMFVMEISINSTFEKCDLCGRVWQEPAAHLESECDFLVTEQVLES